MFLSWSLSAIHVVLTSDRISMRLGRRLLALSLNLLLLQSGWTSGRGECAPSAEAGHDASAMVMTAPAEVSGGDRVAVRDASQGERHDCTGDMLGTDCGLMSGCSTPPPLAANPLQPLPMSATQAVIAFALTSAPIAAPEPEPPPPRA